MIINSFRIVSKLFNQILSVLIKVVRAILENKAIWTILSIIAWIAFISIELSI